MLSNELQCFVNAMNTPNDIDDLLEAISAKVHGMPLIPGLERIELCTQLAAAQKACRRYVLAHQSHTLRTRGA